MRANGASSVDLYLFEKHRVDRDHTRNATSEPRARLKTVRTRPVRPAGTVPTLMEMVQCMYVGTPKEDMYLEVAEAWSDVYKIIDGPATSASEKTQHHVPSKGECAELKAGLIDYAFTD